MRYKILVLGGNGFIGSHLIMECLKKKWEIISLSSKLPPLKKRFKKVKYLACDVSNYEALKKIIKPNYDFVVNLSGYIDHGKKRETFTTHYKGCKNLTQIFRKKHPISFIQMGTSLEYGNLKSPHSEEVTARLSSMKSYYSKAKYLATRHVIKLSKKNNFPGVILRLYQVYGPGQNTNRLIPFVIKSCKNNKKFPCSSGKQIRDFVYVKDVIGAIIKALQSKKCYGEIINIGSGQPVKIKKIILLIKNLIKRGLPQFNKIKLRDEESLYFYPSVKKAKKIINWKPKISLRTGMKLTINSA
jgi:nucleoside-diphosphate-sugar epimerase